MRTRNKQNVQIGFVFRSIGVCLGDIRLFLQLRLGLSPFLVSFLSQGKGYVWLKREGLINDGGVGRGETGILPE